MGVESYSVRLEPVIGDNAPLTVAIVTQTLRENGFQRSALRTEFGPAHLTAPPESQTEFERRDANAVIEAILYWESVPGEPTRPDRLILTGIDIRFAICQPPPVEDVFGEIIQRMVQRHHFAILDGYRNCRYQPEQVATYLSDARPVVAGLQANWRRLFGAGYEKKPLSTAEAWAYYLKRQRSDVEQTSH